RGRQRCRTLKRLRSRSLRRQLRRHTVEEPVLLAHQFCDGAQECLALACQRVGVPTGVARLDVADRSLGDEGAETRLVGLLFEEHELLLGDGQLGPHLLQALGDVDEASLENRRVHGDEQSIGKVPHVIRGFGDGPGFWRAVTSPDLARMAESADATDSKSVAARRVGSSPTPGTASGLLTGSPLPQLLTPEMAGSAVMDLVRADPGTTAPGYLLTPAG